MKTALMLAAAFGAAGFAGCASEISYSEAAHFPRNPSPPSPVVISRVEILSRGGKICGRPLYFYAAHNYKQAIQDKVSHLKAGDSTTKVETLFGGRPAYVGENGTGTVWEYFF